MPYKVVAWDWNGTLMDDRWLCIEVMNELLSKYKKPELATERYLQIFDFPVEKYYRKLGFDFENEHSFTDIGTEFFTIYLQRWQECGLHENAGQVLEYLQKQGYKQIILSNAPCDLLDNYVNYFNVYQFFDEIIGLDHHLATGKKDLALQWLQDSDVDPQSVLLIGDTDHDFQVAQALKVDTLLVTMGHNSHERLVNCTSNIVDDLAAVLQRI